MTVVAAVHGGDRDAVVLAHAHRLAVSFGAELVALQVVRPVEQRPASGPWRYLAPARTASERASRIAHRLLELQIPGRPLVVPQYSGEQTFEAILRGALEAEARVAVMATRGTGVLRQALRRSTAMQTISPDLLPVVLIGPKSAAEPTAHEPYRTLIVVPDHPVHAERLLRRSAPLLQANRANVVLLAVYVPRIGDGGRDAAMAAMGAELQQLSRLVPRVCGVPQVVVWPETAPWEFVAAVVKACRTFSPSLVIVSQSNFDWRRMFSPTDCLEVVNHAPVPVMAFRTSEEER